MLGNSGIKVHGTFLHEWEEHAGEHQKSILQSAVSLLIRYRVVTSTSVDVSSAGGGGME